MKTAASLLLLSLFFSSILLFASVNASTSYVCTGYPGNTLGNIACNPAPNANIIVTNTVIDVGQYSFITVNGISNSIGAAPLPLTGNILYSLTSNVPAANTFNSFRLNSTGNVIIGINAFAANYLVLTANSYSLKRPANDIVANTIFSNSITNTIFGSWTFNAFIFDSPSGGTNTFTTNQIPLIQINPALSVSNVVTTNSIAEQSQTETIRITWTGGASTYTANFIVTNSVNGNKIANALYSGIVGTTNTFTFTLPTSNDGLGTLNVGANVIDSASTPVYTAISTNTIAVNAILAAPTVVATPNSVTQLTAATLSANVPMTGQPPYTYQWFQQRPGYSYVLLSGATSNTYKFGTSQFTVTGTHNFILQVTDSGSTPVIVNSSAVGVLVNATSSGGGSTGVNGGGGTGVGGGIYTTTMATTVTTTIATENASTTVPTTIATTAPSHYNQTLPVSPSQPQTINYSKAFTFMLTSTTTGTTYADVRISNVSASNAPASPSNYTPLSFVNISIDSKLVSVNVTAQYPCSVPSGSIYPYVFKNGTWSAVTPFTVNAGSCTVSFSVGNDPIIALMQYAPAYTTATSTASTVATTMPQTAQSGGSTSTWLIIIIIIVIVIAAAYYFLRNRK